MTNSSLAFHKGLQSSYVLNQQLFEKYPHGFVGSEVNCRYDNVEAISFFKNEFLVLEPKIFSLSQCHSAEVVTIDSVQSFEHACANTYSADAWFVDKRVCEQGKSFFVIKTADCIPVIVLAKNKPYFFIAHCGWRGAVSDLLVKGIKQMLEVGVDAEEMIVLIGPGASLHNYQVGQEVVEAVKASWNRANEIAGGANSCSAIVQSMGSFYCGIKELLSHQASCLGIKEIYISSICTLEDQRFFSHRRQKDLAGRQLSFILA